jgi:hypothetical protein
MGVFLIRTILSKRAAIQRLLIEMQKNSWIISGNNIYLPLPDWYYWLSKYRPLHDITRIVGDILVVWDNMTTFESTMFMDRVTDIEDAIDDIQRLQSVTSQMLNRYFDIPPNLTLPHITSQLNKDYGSVPTPYCTTLRIIEAYSRFIDIQLLGALHVDKEVVSAIIDKEVNDPIYFGVMDYIKSIYSSAELDTILGIMDLSLFTPADSLFYGFWSEELLWEDIHPGFRLRQIANIANEKSLRVEKGKYLDFYDKVSDELRWPSPSQMLKKMTNLNIVDRSFAEASQLFRNANPDLERSVSETYMFELVRTLSKLRLSHQEFPGQPYLTLVNSGELIEPFINFIGDGIMVGDSFGIDKVDLLGSSLQYYVFLDLFNSDFFGLTKKACTKLSKGHVDVLNPGEMEKKLIEGWLFIPHQRIRPVSEISQ